MTWESNHHSVRDERAQLLREETKPFGISQQGQRREVKATAVEIAAHFDLCGAVPLHRHLREAVEHPDNRGRARDRAALNRWQSVVGETDETPLADSQLVGNDDAFEGLLVKLTASLGAGRQNARSGLRAIRRAAFALLKLGEGQLSLRSTLRLCFGRMGITAQEASRRYGKSVLNWLQGVSQPRGSKSAETLTRIAEAAGVNPAILAVFVRPSKRTTVPAAYKKQRHKGEYSLSSRGYLFPSATRKDNGAPHLKPRVLSIPHHLTQAIAAFRQYKNAEAPHLSRIGRWTKNKNGRVAREEHALRVMDRFFGFLSLPTNPATPHQSGLGIPVDELCFAMLGDGCLWEQFIRFLVLRNGTLNSAIQYVNAFKGILHPESGFITQQARRYERELGFIARPEVAALYGARFNFDWRGCTADDVLRQMYLAHPDRQKMRAVPPDVDLFREWASIHYAYLSRIAQDNTNLPKTPHRDPKRRLAEWLSLPNPIDVVFDLIDQMKRKRVAFKGESDARARHEGEIALITAMAAIPLREENWRTAKIPPEFLPSQAPGVEYDYVPNLILKADGWWYREDREAFKNRAAMRSEVYEVRFPDWTQPTINEFIRKWRKKLPGARAGSPFLFVDDRKLERTRERQRQAWEALAEGRLADRVAAITRCYLLLDMGPGLRFHWIRHVVARDFLKRCPEGYKIVADLLNDSLQTVFREYGHPEPQDGFRVYDRMSTARFQERAGVTANTTKQPSTAQLKKELEATRAKLTAAEQRIAELELLLENARGSVAA